MARAHGMPTTVALIVCLVGNPWGGTLFASDEEPSSNEAPSSQPVGTTTSEGPEATSPSAAIPVDRPAMEGNLFSGPPSKRSPFPLTDERLTADAAAGAADAQAWRSTFILMPVESSSFAQRRGYGGRGRGGRNGALAAIVIGAAASIAGTAILVYGNRPECSTNQMASGCGFGTKVVGGAVLSAGLVGVVVGTILWR
jgi:hypothetical protein